MGTLREMLLPAGGDPALTRPRGKAAVLAAAHWAGLPVQRVAEALPQVQ